MAERDRPHLLNPFGPQPSDYTPHPQAIPPVRIPAPPNRLAHGLALERELQEATAPSPSPRPDDAVPGTYLVFESFPGIELAIESMDPRPGRSTKPKPELRSVVLREAGDAWVQEATVFVPETQLKHFNSRIEKYLETASEAKPKSAALVDTIRGIRRATVRALWTDPPEEYPTGPGQHWWEIWLRRRDGNELDRLKRFAETRGLPVSDTFLGFADRTVALLRAAESDLTDAMEIVDDLAELRLPRDQPVLIPRQSASDQAEWVQDLLSRLEPAAEGSPAVCVLDTGTYREHPLLSASLSIADMHAVDPSWGVDDHDGHGTEMSGLALFGDLGAALAGGVAVRLSTCLESVKLLPPVGANPPALYGALTSIAVNLPEIAEPTRRRAFSMAVTNTANDQPRVGSPTAWSSALDALAAGRGVDVRDDGLIYLDEDTDPAPRLLLVAAGNVREYQVDHIVRSQLDAIEDPAQAWNVVTVGAFTDLDDMSSAPAGFEGHSALAPRGELSPSSRTSFAFTNAWPHKPEVVFEGGNISVSPTTDHFDTPDNLAVVTTSRSVASGRLLTTTRETSAATAQAANFAARLLGQYPSYWPETIRALMVHSAEWTPAMRARFDGASGKRERSRVSRMYGMGVPSFDKAALSATDSATLVTQATIHPFDGDGRMRQMNFHELPWPAQALQDLGASTVQLRVTLSYFIEPNPARRGWKRRYSYASHGLRFDIRRASEETEDFKKRVNAKALAEDERRPASASDSNDWHFGPEHQQASGSLHSDIWRGTAADLADRAGVAVYPVTGWWKENPRRDKSERGARYALVVSIEADGLDVDVWTPIANQIGVQIPV